MGDRVGGVGFLWFILMSVSYEPFSSFYYEKCLSILGFWRNFLCTQILHKDIVGYTFRVLLGKSLLWDLFWFWIISFLEKIFRHKSNIFQAILIKRIHCKNSQRLLESTVITKTNNIKQCVGFYHISPYQVNIILNENKIKIEYG